MRSAAELDFGEGRRITHILGSRMMGGGFGGCTINLIESARTENFIAEISAPYQAAFGRSFEPVHRIYRRRRNCAGS
ncbi:MAG: hypothetical protein R3E60_00765 [Alphaproteobacteria bacterium]